MHDVREKANYFCVSLFLCGGLKKNVYGTPFRRYLHNIRTIAVPSPHVNRTLFDLNIEKSVFSVRISLCRSGFWQVYVYNLLFHCLRVHENMDGKFKIICVGDLGGSTKPQATTR